MPPCLFVFSELGGLLKYVRPFLNSISKAKAARLVRSLLDLFLDMEAATGQEVELCLECIEWAKVEKRTFLRQALEVRPQARLFPLPLLWFAGDKKLFAVVFTHNSPDRSGYRPDFYNPDEDLFSIKL